MRLINNQRHAKTCGQTAVANALKSKGVSTSYNEIIKLMGKKAVKFEDVKNMLIRNDIRFKIINPTFEKMKKELDSGNKMIVLLKWSDGEGGGHYFFLEGYSSEYFKGVNYYKNNRRYILKKKLANHLRFSYRYYKKHKSGYPKAIVLL